MSPDSFERLANANPEAREPLMQIAHWVGNHRDWKWIDPTILASDLPLSDSFALAAALVDAVEAGLLVPKYTVLDPSGVLSNDVFDSPASIPDELYDRFEQVFDTRNYPIIPIFEDALEQNTKFVSKPTIYLDEDAPFFIALAAEAELSDEEAEAEEEEDGGGFSGSSGAL